MDRLCADARVAVELDGARLLLDTNVLVAALIAHGACSDVLEHSIRQHEVVSSQPLLEELREVLPRKFRQRPIDVRATLLLFRETFPIVTPTPLESAVCRDPDDDVVLATALTGACAAIISGDQDLLVLDPFRGIHVRAPSAFWKWEAEFDDTGT
ncbi:MAG: putative toxin-antitoxin system toxin component, PIN family [Vicinamibacterales bacterium]